MALSITVRWKRVSNPSPVIEYLSFRYNGYEIPAMFANLQIIRKFWSVYREMLVSGWQPTHFDMGRILKRLSN